MSSKDLPRDRAAELLAQVLRFAVRGLTAEAAASWAKITVDAVHTERDRERDRKREKAQWRREQRYHDARDRRRQAEAPQGRRPHDILGVCADATIAEIQAAWRTEARRRHPDAGGDHTAMAELNAARDAMMRERAAA